MTYLRPDPGVEEVARERRPSRDDGARASIGVGSTVSTLQRTCVGSTRTSFTAGGCSLPLRPSHAGIHSEGLAEVVSGWWHSRASARRAASWLTDLAELAVRTASQSGEPRPCPRPIGEVSVRKTCVILGGMTQSATCTRHLATEPTSAHRLTVPSYLRQMSAFDRPPTPHADQRPQQATAQRRQSPRAGENREQESPSRAGKSLAGRSGAATICRYRG
jgi:hypothetical protein